MAELTPEQKDRFLNDLESIVVDAEKLLRRAGGGRETRGIKRPSAELRGGLRATVRHARATAAGLDGNVGVQAKALSSAVDDYVRHEPWLILGVAAGVGLMLGLLIGHRR